MSGTCLVIIQGQEAAPKPLKHQNYCAAPSIRSFLHQRGPSWSMLTLQRAASRHMHAPHMRTGQAAHFASSPPQPLIFQDDLLKMRANRSRNGTPKRASLLQSAHPNKARLEILKHYLDHIKVHAVDETAFRSAVATFLAPLNNALADVVEAPVVAFKVEEHMRRTARNQRMADLVHRKRSQLLRRRDTVSSRAAESEGVTGGALHMARVLHAVKSVRLDSQADVAARVATGGDDKPNCTRASESHAAVQVG
jgi:hypothetical protein